MRINVHIILPKTNFCLQCQTRNVKETQILINKYMKDISRPIEINKNH